MSRRVTHDGQGNLEVRFPFDRALVDRVKSLPHRRWNGTARCWIVPDIDAVALVDLLLPERFGFDEATRNLYAGMGGTAVLDQVTPAQKGPVLPGLFDSPGDKPAAQPPDEYTVSRLNERVRSVIESAFPGTVWVVGEISGFDKNAHRRHISFELAERTDSGSTVSKIPATLFESTRHEIDRGLGAAGDPFRLQDEIAVRLRVRVELYVPWGQYRVVVEELDVNYTLGEAARRREEIVRHLTEAGLVGRNSALPVPSLPLRVGLVTSLGSDACNDVLRTLQESGFAFQITVHGARVQGKATEPSVLNALDWFGRRAGRFDALLVCRGGGSRTDLMWFDSEPLGRAVARFPLPVIVGIGHEQDQSVLDAVGRSCKTPTAAAALLVQTVAESLDRLEAAGLAVLTAAGRKLRDESQRRLERTSRLVLLARHLLQAERGALLHRRRRAVTGAGTLLAGARRLVAGWSFSIPRQAWRELEREKIALAGRLRGMVQGARRELAVERDRLGRVGNALTPGCTRLVAREEERMAGREQRLRLVDPRSVLERGYALLRVENGEVLTRAGQAPEGTMVQARLKSGSLRLRSEGKGGD